MRKQSAYQAVNMLEAMARGYLRLSDQMFDSCQDALVELLERANNQRGQAFTRHAELEQSDVETTDDGEIISKGPVRLP